MATPRVLILRAPGTNCDVETAYAFELAGATPQVLHVNRLKESPHLLADHEILCIPGGFSYGDDIAAGRILANQMQHYLQETLVAFKEAGKLILGICNGFQVLLKSGVLLPVVDGAPQATLTWNDSGRFEDRWVYLGTDSPQCVFLRDVSRLYLPIAHAEGKFVSRDDATLRTLADAGQLAVRYLSGPEATIAEEPLGFPANPNGSPGGITGITTTDGRVTIMMPHPERVFRTVQNSWHPADWKEDAPAMRMFRNARVWLD